MILPLLLLAAMPQAAGPDVMVTAPGKANAQTPATLVVEPAAMFVVACDEDHDGYTVRLELDACIARTFAGMKPDKDGAIGYLSYSDWALMWLGDRTALPSPFEVDRNGDDRITLDELQLQFSRLFTRYDKDGDKRVGRAEALTIRAVAADGKGPLGRGGPPRKRDRPKGERIPRGQPEQPDQP